MSHSRPVQLKRILTLPLMVLYGLGVTIGAGIYVLIGETAARAGMLAPMAFIGAAVVMLFPALCFAELSVRYPFSSGAAQYVEESFGSRMAGLFIGLLMISAGLVAASTISLGSVRYLSSIIAVPPWIILVVVVSLMGMVCAWGISESVAIAALMTLVEISGLLAVIVGGFVFDFDLLTHVERLMPSEMSSAVANSILQASLLAFFAFIGFEGISNIAEEALEPRETLPKAIILTLAISTAIYVMVVGVALLTVGPHELATQQAPLSHLFEQTTGLPAVVITLIAVIATLNGVIVQIIMVSRLTYGLSSRHLLPTMFSVVHPTRKTPVRAIAVTTLLILAFTLVVPVTILAEWTSRIILLVFTIVCFALLRLKLSAVPAPADSFEVSPVIPALGSILCGALLIADILWS
jgi:basic amino acid/polyamine antiporter, APA family